MVHYSCDLCARHLGDGTDPRFVVRITAQAVHDPARVTADDLDLDSLEAVAEALQAADPAAVPAPEFVELRYDLCPDCHARFVRDPLRCGPAATARFSTN